MNAIKACIFDLDGVIIDTAKYHFKAWSEIAENLGIQFDQKLNENLKGVGRMESLDYILSLANVTKSDEEKIELATTKNNNYLKLIANIDRKELLNGVLSFLDDLKKNNFLIALGSSSKNAKLILDTVQLSPYFDAIIDGNDTTHSKPDPEVFIKGSVALGVSPKNIVVFEDAPKGVEAAKKGGFKCIGIGEWKNLIHADYVMDGFSNFLTKDLARIY